MGASRKLQGEIDRVLKKVQEGVDVFDSIWNKVYDTENANQKEKFEADLKKEIKKLQRYRDQIKTWIQSSEIKDKKVSASYEQALMDARKQIEREMERFKICEKETKTKAFSKEGLGQQPKTDPREKAKSETRDWLNNAVGDLESQIDNFEAELESLSVKKGKAKPPRLTHLETSIGRHKAHVMKLELILRLLDNDELSTEQVNDVKDFIEDYVERNQDDFDEFSDVDELYSTLPLEKLESLEELVPTGSSVLLKATGSVSNASSVVGPKNPVPSSPAQVPIPLVPTSQQGKSAEDQTEETASQDSNSDIALRATPSKTGVTGTTISATPASSVPAPPTMSNMSAAVNVIHNLTSESVAATAAILGPGSVQGAVEISAASSSLVNPPSSLRDDDNVSFVGRRPSPAPSEMTMGKGIVRGSAVAGLSNQAPIIVPVSLGSMVGISGSGAPGAAPTISDIAKRSVLNSEERNGTGNLTQPPVSPLNSRTLLQQVSKSSDGFGLPDANSAAETSVIGGRVFSPSVVSGVQWRPQSMNSFQNQSEAGQLRGRTEIAPDQKEKYLQRLQQQQQGSSNLLNVSHLLGANQKQFLGQQHNLLLQQIGVQNLSTQVGLGVQVPSLTNAMNTPQQQTTTDAGHVKVEEPLQLTTSDVLDPEVLTASEPNKNVDDDFKILHTAAIATSAAETSQLPRDTDLSPKKPLQTHQFSSSLGVIGRRSISDLGAIGDNISGSSGNSGNLQEQIYNLQMLESAFYKLPQPKDSERVKNYIARHPAPTPSSYPQVQAPIINNPAFWERLGAESLGSDTLFFAFYYQQNTYQQYLAARELKKQSWRYHRRFNTWFQRHEEPKVTTDDFEQGTYVYFDSHIADDNQQHGWCQRIKTDFTFEYSYLEDELVV